MDRPTDPNDDALRFALVTPDDQSGTLWIVTILALVYAAMACTVRVRVKWGIYGVEDWLFGLAIVLLVVQAAVVMSGLKNSGLGKARTDFSGKASPSEGSGLAVLRSEMLNIVASSLVKCSVIVLIIRVFVVDKGKMHWICSGLLVLSVVWAIGSIVGLVAQCKTVNDLADATSGGSSLADWSSCPAELLRWQCITAVDIAIEAILSFLPGIAVADINMPLSSKLQVLCFFAFRLFLIPLSALHLAYMDEFITSARPLLAAANPLLLQQARITWSVVSATIPNMKGFVIGFSTNLGVIVPRTATGTCASGGGESFALQTIGSVPARRRQSWVVDQEGTDDGPQVYPLFRPHDILHETMIAGGRGGTVGATAGEDGVSDTGSQEMIIRKEMHWEVSRDQSRSPIEGVEGKFLRC